MEYQLEIVVGDNMDADPEEVFFSDQPFGAFAVGDASLPGWRYPGPPTFPKLYLSDRAKIRQIEHYISGKKEPRKTGGTDATGVTTRLYCDEVLDEDARRSDD